MTGAEEIFDDLKIKTETPFFCVPSQQKIVVDLTISAKHIRLQRPC